MTTTNSIEWRPIDGFEGYEVSNTGMIRSWLPVRNYAPIPSEPRVLKTIVGRRTGYRKLMLQRNGERITKNVAPLVASAWHGPIPFDGAVVRHLDGSRTNDNAENLRWGTQKENIADSMALGAHAYGTRVNTAKLTEADVRCIIDSSLSNCALGRSYGVSAAAIWAIKHGKTWKHLRGTQV